MGKYSIQTNKDQNTSPSGADYPEPGPIGPGAAQSVKPKHHWTGGRTHGYNKISLAGAVQSIVTKHHMPGGRTHGQNKTSLAGGRAIDRNKTSFMRAANEFNHTPFRLDPNKKNRAIWPGSNIIVNIFRC